MPPTYNTPFLSAKKVELFAIHHQHHHVSFTLMRVHWQGFQPILLLKCEGTQDLFGWTSIVDLSRDENNSRNLTSAGSLDITTACLICWSLFICPIQWWPPKKTYIIWKLPSHHPISSLNPTSTCFSLQCYFCWLDSLPTWPLWPLWRVGAT